MIFLGADHRGFELKEKIKRYFDEKAYKYADCGAFSEERSDFPLIAEEVCQKMDKHVDLAILICGSGIGMCMAANKIKGIRAGVCFNKEVALDGKEHSNINCLVLPGDFIKEEEAIEIVETWLKSQFLGGRYQSRIEMIEKIEEN